MTAPASRSRITLRPACWRVLAAAFCAAVSITGAKGATAAERWILSRQALVACGIVLLAGPATAEEALVAVAANFKDVMSELETEFERDTGHELTVTIGSTGQLYAQIVNGAPFDVLLAADQERPERLEGEGHAVSGSRFTYAVGRLALWSPDAGRIGADGAGVLKRGDFRKLAIANPDLAPYGAAAMEVLEALGLAETLRPRIVMGENIGQTFTLVATGNVELGFVALSYVLAPQNEQKGSRWDVPAGLYSPIRQDAVLLEHGIDNAAARDFMEFLKSGEARAAVEEFGYGSTSCLVPQITTSFRCVLSQLAAFTAQDTRSCPTPARSG